MTDQYEPKGPFRADNIYILDASGLGVGCAFIAARSANSAERTYINPDFAARIADALNAEERVKELEAFREMVASMLLGGERDDGGAVYEWDAESELDVLTSLIRQARALKPDEGDGDDQAS